MDVIKNRIPVKFEPGWRVVTGPHISYQHDAKQYLVIQGLDLPDYFVVDFCNEGDAYTVPITGNAEGVLIPDDYLLTGKNIKAYVVLTGDDEGAVETRYEIKLPVRKRPARTDIQPTPKERQEIDELVENMNNAVSRSETAAEEAEEAVEEAKEIFGDKAPAIKETASGTVVTINDGADGMPVNATVQIAAVQEGEGRQTPTNVRPIHGWTECVIPVTQDNFINLADGEGETVNNVTGEYYQDGGLYFGGYDLPGGDMYCGAYRLNQPLVLKPGTYTFSFSRQASMIGSEIVFLHGWDEVFRIPEYIWEYTVTFDSTVVADRIAPFLYDVSSGVNYGGYLTSLMIVQGETPATYEAFKGDTRSVDWGEIVGTVFNGALTINADGTGKLSSNFKFVDLGDLTWTKKGTFESEVIDDISTQELPLCSHYQPIQYSIWGGSLSNQQLWIYRSKIQLRDDSYTDAATFTEAVTGVQFVYPVYTTEEYDLTAEQVGQIKTMLGKNIIRASTGDITVEYTADTKTFILSHSAEYTDDGNGNITIGIPEA